MFRHHLLCTIASWVAYTKNVALPAHLIHECLYIALTPFRYGQVDEHIDPLRVEPQAVRQRNTGGCTAPSHHVIM